MCDFTLEAGIKEIVSYLKDELKYQEYAVKLANELGLRIELIKETK